ASLRAFCLVPDIRRACSASIIGSHQPSAISHQPSAISQQSTNDRPIKRSTTKRSSDQPSNQAINQQTHSTACRTTRSPNAPLNRPG
ncbi:hypothetical protein, partial [Xanthomonas arboricola]|uniref:hypothetical protein n=1 Tax=Xanthomonas arboricola TaxID=56448 RepID=UPI0035EE2BCD